MDINSLLSKIAKKNIVDYSYAVIFFAVFSFFMFAVIRPNIITVFSLQKEKENLTVIDTAYTAVISQIIDIQSAFESTRNDIYVLDDALPTTPNVNKLINDLQTVAGDSQISVKKMALSQINLKKESQKTGYDSINIQFEADASYDQLQKFISNLFMQRRLKTITDLTVIKTDQPGISSGSANLTIKIKLVGYYL